MTNYRNAKTWQEIVYGKARRKQRQLRKKQQKTARQRVKGIVYAQYINSKDWYTKRRQFIQSHKTKTCDICGGLKPSQVHHKHYGTLGREKNEDLAYLCSICHHNVHHVGDERLPNHKSVLVARFNELRFYQKGK